MRYLACSFLFLSGIFLASCRADFVEPPLDIPWEELESRGWMVTRTSNEQIVPLGTTHQFTTDQVFMSYRRQGDTYCAQWDKTRRGMKVTARLARDDFEFEVKKVTDDSLEVRMLSPAGTVDLTYNSADLAYIQFNREAFNTPADLYTATDRTGIISSVDDDDWRVSPFAQCELAVQPGYPNPVAQSDSFTVQVLVDDPTHYREGLILASNNASNRTTTIARIQAIPRAGVYRFRGTFSSLRVTGLRRVYVYHPSGTVLSYGDVLVRPDQ